jgi:putative flippase GtrA
MKLALPEFVRFCIVGGTLFLFDVLMLELLAGMGISAFIARLISLALALQLAYVAHGLFTFRNHSGFNRRTWLGFMAANLLGACINYGIFAAVITLMGQEQGTASRISGIVAGTAVALFFNYAMNRRYVFRRKDT